MFRFTNKSPTNTIQPKYNLEALEMAEKSRRFEESITEKHHISRGYQNNVLNRLGNPIRQIIVY